MPVIQFQVCLVFPLCTFTVHHIPVKDRHGMVLTGKLWLSRQFFRFLPQSQTGLIGRYTPKCVLDRSPAEIRRHLRKTKVKIKPGRIVLRCMHQMLCNIKTLFELRDFPQFFPYLCIDTCQVTDCLAVDLQSLADRDILFSYLHTITGYCTHFLPLS